MSPHANPMSPTAAYQELVDHKNYRYRGCAPDPDEPWLAAGGTEQDGKTVRVPLSAWSAPDLDGGEPQDVRIAREAAAIDVCVGCAVMVACARYANTVDSEGHVTEPQGVLGGERGLDRHRRLIARRHEVVAAAPDARFDTDQKRDILKALALRWDAREVAQVALMDIRKANWHRSNVANLLGLPKTATRMQVLEAAQARGLVPASWVRADDGTVPAVVTGMKATEETVQGPRRTAGRKPGRAKFAAIEGQLHVEFDVARREPSPVPEREPASDEPLDLVSLGQLELDLDAELAALTAAPVAVVHSLPTAMPLEAAA
ncbi:hypothetical protein [Streptomyces sp. NPDC055105]|uniref:hypothetical protein n=1 Tax=Streptomyces sp. NPDC055105 TaxID=3365719 RepID=UPI0037D7A8AA